MFRYCMRSLLLLTLLSVLAEGQTAEPRQGSDDWPQYRGPNRQGISSATGLLKEWPNDGPPLLWKAEGLGQGVPPVSIAAGRVYGLGYRDKDEYLTALDVKDGKLIWSVRIGPAVAEQSAMRWLSQRAPTVDGDRIYAFTAGGELICLETAAGKERWRQNYLKDFGGKRGPWGYCDFPLVDGDRLICTPGGNTATLLALNKLTGEVIWKCPLPEGDRATHGPVVVSEAAGVRQYVHQLDRGVIGVSAADGKLLWRYQGIVSASGNVHTPLVKDDLLFCSGGWGAGCALIKLVRGGGEFKVEELYRANRPFDSWLGGSVLLCDRVYTSEGMCIELMTGKLLGRTKRPGNRVTMACADGHLYHRYTDNTVVLSTATAEGFQEKSIFKFPTSSKEPTWTTPVIAEGRLFLRDQDVLLCYDIQEKKRSRGPRPIFVPSPQDVVEEMLQLAKVTKDDVVVDLGCGDGRIVATAARNYCCKAVGYDIDPQCIELASAAVREAGVDSMVNIEQRDIFDVDLSKATVVTLYLLPEVNVKLIPQLEKMKPGSRIVSHAFDIKGVKPDKVIRFTSKEDDLERPLYLWTLPLKKDKAGGEAPPPERGTLRKSFLRMAPPELVCQKEHWLGKPRPVTLAELEGKVVWLQFNF
jgi:outer membrane protein assembly factor BamB